MPADSSLYGNRLNNITNNASTNSLAQHMHTDNNSYTPANGFYMNTAPYRRGNAYHETTNMNGNNSKYTNGTTGGRAAKAYENETNNKKRSYHQNKAYNNVHNKTTAPHITEINDNKRYSDIVTGNSTTTNSNNVSNSTNLNETSSSVSPSNIYNTNQEEKQNFEYNNNLPTVYNPTYNQSSHLNQYPKNGKFYFYFQKLTFVWVMSFRIVQFVNH